MRCRHIGQRVFIGFLLPSRRKHGSQNICLHGMAENGSCSRSKQTGQIKVGSSASSSGSASKISCHNKLLAK